MASASAIAEHVQLVLTDRTVLSDGRDFGVLSPLTWRLADLGAKHAFLKAALGWGHMPLHMVKADLDSGALVKIRIEGTPRAWAMPMSVVFRKDAPPGGLKPPVNVKLSVPASVAAPVTARRSNPEQVMAPPNSISSAALVPCE